MRKASLSMKKNHLLTPGPTQIPPNVLARFAEPIIHHRTPAFQVIFEEVKNDLKYLFQTQQDVLMLTCTGTGAMDAAVCNLFKKGDTVITINCGKFGERWTKIAQAYGLKAAEIKTPTGEAVSPAQVEQAVAANPGAKAILFQASETSTGVVLPTKEICAIARKAGMISVCDAITALGVFPLPMDEWGIDVLITGSQKALMIPPGLAMIALSDKAWTMAETADLPHFYFDLKKERKGLSTNQTAWTPAISLIQGLRESLRMIREEGLENLYRRHEKLARATRHAVQHLGLELLSPKAPSNAVTAVKVPAAITDGKKILKVLRDQHGVTLIGGQDELEGKIIRLSHFGYCDKFDIITAIAALELVLNEMGYPVPYGKGVGAAMHVFAEN